MKKLILSFILFAFLLSATPSKDFLLQTDEKVIANQLRKDFLSYERYQNFFHHVIEAENEFFIGYHATSLQHFIFQEFVKAAIEIKYGIQTPEDFYYLRVPYNSFYDTEGTSYIFKQFDRPTFLKEELKNVINEIVNNSLFSLCQLKLNIPEEKIEELYHLLLVHVPFMPNKALTKEEASEKLKKELKKLNFSKNHLLDQAIDTFSDNPFADEFRGLYSIDSILFPFDDTHEELQKRIVSLNISLFGNFDISTESTLHIFLKNQSVEIYKADLFFLNCIQHFLTELNLNFKEVEATYNWALENFPKETGVLLQFFYEGDEPLENFLYVCDFYGIPDFEKLTSEAISQNLNKQLRLVLTNKIALNPFSGLIIKEYDLFNPKLKETLRKKIRTALQGDYGSL